MAPAAFDFVCGLIRMFYAPTWVGAAAGLKEVAAAALFGGSPAANAAGGTRKDE